MISTSECLFGNMFIKNGNMFAYFVDEEESIWK